MDSDIARWILEFLLRSSVQDSIVKKIFKVLPLSGVDSRLQKTLLLRDIQSELSTASFTETLLEALEIIEELDRIDGIAITETMKQAYCAVAVECTIKHLAASPDSNNNEGLYFDAVKRIWRGRVREMENAASSSGERSELLTDELIEFKDNIEAALWDSKVCKRLANGNARRVAIDKVSAYLAETWEFMGPSFLELAAKLSEGKGMHSLNKDVATCRPDDGCHFGVCEPELASDRMDVCEARSPNTERDIQKGKLPLKRMHKRSSIHSRGVKIIDAEEGGPKVCSKDDPVSSVEVRKLRESLKSSSSELKALVKDPLPDALHKSDIVRAELAMKGISLELPLEIQSIDVEEPEPNTCRSIVIYQPIDDFLKKISSVNCSDDHHRSLMERNSTAHVYEWDDSIDNLPASSPRKRRKLKRWSSLEEETLIAGVKKFGKGQWKSILNMYNEIFSKAGRTDVDLKDKWRNMTRVT